MATLRGREPLLPAAASRIRQPGSGRRKIEVVEPAIGRHLRQILEETTAEDPMSVLKWTSKSTRTHRGGVDAVRYCVSARQNTEGHPELRISAGRVPRASALPVCPLTASWSQAQYRGRWTWPYPLRGRDRWGAPAARVAQASGRRG
jgi:hypothetical protein